MVQEMKDYKFPQILHDSAMWLDQIFQPIPTNMELSKNGQVTWAKFLWKGYVGRAKWKLGKNGILCGVQRANHESAKL